LHKDRPSYTIIAAGGGGTWTYHYSEPRPLTNRERARLQTFPDNFEFVGSISEVRKQIGNAVPPKGIRPIAKELRRILKNNKRLESKGRQSPLKNFSWMKREHDADKYRKILRKHSNIARFGLPDWRGIETYSTNEITDILTNKNMTVKLLKDIIKDHFKFYCNYYGKNGGVNPRMNLCEYNVYSAYSLLHNKKAQKKR